jgi:molybdate transport system substrate-binding protein
VTRVKPWMIACASLLAAALTTGACAAELKVFASVGVQSALEELAPKFETATGNTLNFTWAASGILLKRVQAGETADVMVLSKQDLDTLTKAGKASAGPDADLVSAGLAVFVKTGSPKPDISTPEAFKQALLKAKTLAFADPTSGIASGVYIAKLLERMGIAEQMQPKIRHPPAGANSASLVANGEAELGIQLEPEVMAAAAVDLVGPIPAELNNSTTFSVGIGAGSQQSAAAATLIKFLHSPEAVAVSKKRGLTPIATPKAP